MVVVLESQTVHARVHAQRLTDSDALAARANQVDVVVVVRRNVFLYVALDNVKVVIVVVSNAAVR